MPFISFACLIALARTSNTMLNRSSEGRYPCDVPNLKGKVFIKNIMLGLGFSQMLSIRLTKFPSSTSWLSVFYHKRVLRCVKCLFYVYWDDHVFSDLYSIDTAFYSNWFSDIKLTLHLWDKFHLVVACNPLYVLLDLICSCFVKTFLHLYS